MTDPEIPEAHPEIIQLKLKRGFVESLAPALACHVADKALQKCAEGAKSGSLAEICASELEAERACSGRVNELVKTHCESEAKALRRLAQLFEQQKNVTRRKARAMLERLMEYQFDLYSCIADHDANLGRAQEDAMMELFEDAGISREDLEDMEDEFEDEEDEVPVRGRTRSASLRSVDRRVGGTRGGRDEEEEEEEYDDAKEEDEDPLLLPDDLDLDEASEQAELKTSQASAHQGQKAGGDGAYVMKLDETTPSAAPAPAAPAAGKSLWSRVFG